MKGLLSIARYGAAAVTMVAGVAMIGAAVDGLDRGDVIGFCCVGIMAASCMACAIITTWGH